MQFSDCLELDFGKIEFHVKPQLLENQVNWKKKKKSYIWYFRGFINYNQ